MKCYKMYRYFCGLLETATVYKTPRSEITCKYNNYETIHQLLIACKRDVGNVGVHRICDWYHAPSMQQLMSDNCLKQILSQPCAWYVNDKLKHNILRKIRQQPDSVSTTQSLACIWTFLGNLRCNESWCIIIKSGENAVMYVADCSAATHNNTDGKDRHRMQHADKSNWRQRHHQQQPWTGLSTGDRQAKVCKAKSVRQKVI